MDPLWKKLSGSAHVIANLLEHGVIHNKTRTNHKNPQAMRATHSDQTFWISACDCKTSNLLEHEVIHNKTRTNHKKHEQLEQKYTITQQQLIRLLRNNMRREGGVNVFYLPNLRTIFNLFDRSFTYSAPKLWNNLPNTVRNSSSLNSFKSNLKHVLYTRPFKTNNYLMYCNFK